MNPYYDIYDFEKIASPRRPIRKKSTIEPKVFAFAALVVCVGLFSVTLNQSVLGSNYYSVFAYFDAVDGLSEGADVEIAGVHVGRVKSISLAPQGQALVEMRIRNQVALADDTVAAVILRGLTGKHVVKLHPGRSAVLIPHEGVVRETESVIDLTGLLGEAILGRARPGADG